MEEIVMTVSLPQIAKAIDHSLLDPTMTDAQVAWGLEVAKRHRVAAACVKPYSVPVAAEKLEGTGVLVCAVVGFPHGSTTTAAKVYEAEEALASGAHEIDAVVNLGKVLGGDWEYVTNEIRAVNDVCVNHHAALKVILENDFLDDEHITYLCRICSSLSVAFAMTSTGYGFVRQPSGYYAYEGATVPHLSLMRHNVGPNVQIKAAGGIRTLDEFLVALWTGATRIGVSATEAILSEASARGIGTMPVQVSFPRPRL